MHTHNNITFRWHVLNGGFVARFLSYATVSEAGIVHGVSVVFHLPAMMGMKQGVTTV